MNGFFSTISSRTSSWDCNFVTKITFFTDPSRWQLQAFVFNKYNIYAFLCFSLKNICCCVEIFVLFFHISIVGLYPKYVFVIFRIFLLEVWSYRYSDIIFRGGVTLECLYSFINESLSCSKHSDCLHTRCAINLF